MGHFTKYSRTGCIMDTDAVIQALCFTRACCSHRLSWSQLFMHSGLIMKKSLSAYVQTIRDLRTWAGKSKLEPRAYVGFSFAWWSTAIEFPLESDHPHCHILGIESSRDIWLSIPAPLYSPRLSIRITSKALVGEFVRCKYFWSLGKRLWHGGRVLSKCRSRERKLGDRPQEKICDSSWCSEPRLIVDSQAGCTSPRAGVSFGAPLPAVGGGGELKSHPSKCSLLNTHVHTHIQQLSTGKQETERAAALVRRAVQMGSCYTLIVS